MNILLTNDDGINSNGLKELEKVLLNYGNVYVFAPETQQSGKACSINSFIGIKVKKLDEFHYAVEGSPVDCVEAAYALLDKKIEFTYTESYGQGGMLDRTKLKFDLKVYSFKSPFSF